MALKPTMGKRKPHPDARLPKAVGALAVLLVGPRLAHAQEAFRLTGDFWRTHDPSIAKQADTWYVFATGKAPGAGQIAIRCSTDLRQWHLCGHVFDAIPEWIRRESPGTTDLWAPDISFYKGEYRLYYAYSLFGKNTSGIALATNRTLNSADPDYKWVDRGLVLRSGSSDDFNAIDPNFVVDRDGKSWLAFGSFWSGIKLRRLNGEGKVSSGDSTLYSLARRKPPNAPEPSKPGFPPDWQAVEAPFIFPHDSYYYLFVSWDLCCRGAKSTYRTVAGRSHEITGPYLDRAGRSMEDGGGTQVLGANGAWVGPGGGSAFADGSRDLFVFHAYDSSTGRPALQISTVEWNAGWPAVALGTEHEPTPNGKEIR